MNYSKGRFMELAAQGHHARANRLLTFVAPPLEHMCLEEELPVVVKHAVNLYPFWQRTIVFTSNHTIFVGFLMVDRIILNGLLESALIATGEHTILLTGKSSMRGSRILSKKKNENCNWTPSNSIGRTWQAGCRFLLARGLNKTMPKYRGVIKRSNKYYYRIYRNGTQREYRVLSTAEEAFDICNEYING